MYSLELTCVSFSSTKVRRAVGEALLQEAEAVHAELLTLLDIWRDYRADTDAAYKGPYVLWKPGRMYVTSSKGSVVKDGKRQRRRDRREGLRREERGETEKRQRREERQRTCARA
jgi:hypothetical protein